MAQVDEDGTTDYSMIKIVQFEARDNANIILYPNPTNGNINLNFNGQEVTNFNIEIIDMLGRSILKQTLENSTQTIDVQHLASGKYILRVAYNNKIELFNFDKL